MKFLYKNLSLITKIISWFQIAGGIAGLGLIAYLLTHTEAINGPVLLIFLTGIGLYIFSIYCGTTLLSPLTTKKGLILSLINQFLQIFQWFIAGTGISYSSGVELSFGFKRSLLNFDFNLVSSSFAMSINSNTDFLLKINVIAIFLFLVLREIYIKIKQVDVEEIPEPVSPIEAVDESLA